MKNLVLVLLAAVRRARAPEPPDPLATRFRWMAGCWSGAKGESTFREIWTPAAPDMMLGMSSDQPWKPTEFEYMRIQTRDGMRHSSWPSPKACPPPTSSASRIRPRHRGAREHGARLPQARDLQEGRRQHLLAWIDGGAEGSQRMEFPMKRVACPAPQARTSAAATPASRPSSAQTPAQLDGRRAGKGQEIADHVRLVEVAAVAGHRGQGASGSPTRAAAVWKRTRRASILGPTPT